jgi:transcriptional regulator with XRE-family HTH domain
MVSFMNIGKRLKEERERLGMAQPAFAAVVGASKSSLIRWEAGAQTPDALAFSMWAGIGVDVLYVITGTRSYVALTRAEEALIDNYRHCDEHGRSIVDATSIAVAKPAAKVANSSR